MTPDGKDLSALFSLRKNFTIIALTGQQGSRYEDVCEQLSQGFDESFEYPSQFDLRLNSYRKYKIVYNYARVNFRPYVVLKYKNIVVLYLLKYTFNDLMTFVGSLSLMEHAARLKSLEFSADYSQVIPALRWLEDRFLRFKDIFNKFDFVNQEIETANTEFIDQFFSVEFDKFCSDFYSCFVDSSSVKNYLFVDIITNNIRKAGHPFVSDTEVQPDKVFSIAELLNYVIKNIRRQNRSHNGKNRATKIVIDSLRVPLEVMFFKQRYSAFYLIAVNRDDKLRETVLKRHYRHLYEDMSILFEDEYSGGKGGEFYKKYIRECIEKADIHITFRSFEDAKILNELRSDRTSPYFSWKMQLLKYVSLIEHPGIITPSPEERSMQLAFAAKCNSGCISRQVGAAITDENYSVKAIGWNNTPQGQTPCLLRDGDVLLTVSDEQIDKEDAKEKVKTREIYKARRKHLTENIEKTYDLEGADNLSQELSTFTPYEKSASFRSSLSGIYSSSLSKNRKLLDGRNVCFCFKSVKNSFSEGKNQVHTRSLHAEESAFLQITKYGGVGVHNGKLFTTASPCELCSKKAYQLGIKVIYYLDPYPGISKSQILDAGSNKPELRLFSGAIGNAYHWLYEPLMPYKDELSLTLGLDLQDLASKQQKRINELEKEVRKLKEQADQKDTTGL